MIGLFCGFELVNFSLEVFSQGILLLTLLQTRDLTIRRVAGTAEIEFTLHFPHNDPLETIGEHSVMDEVFNQELYF